MYKACIKHMSKALVELKKTVGTPLTFSSKLHLLIHLEWLYGFSFYSSPYILELPEANEFNFEGVKYYFWGCVGQIAVFMAEVSVSWF